MTQVVTRVSWSLTCETELQPVTLNIHFPPACIIWGTRSGPRSLSCLPPGLGSAEGKLDDLASSRFYRGPRLGPVFTYQNIIYPGPAPGPNIVRHVANTRTSFITELRCSRGRAPFDEPSSIFLNIPYSHRWCDCTISGTGGQTGW